MQIDAVYNLDPIGYTEKDMQSQLSTFLYTAGFSVQNQVRMGNKGIADIIAEHSDITYIIECKKRLRRNDFYTAHGQVSWYATQYRGDDIAFKSMVVYGGEHRTSFDANTIFDDVIVMWYYDALHFFSAFSKRVPYTKAGFTGEKQPVRRKDDRDPMSILRSIPGFVEYCERQWKTNSDIWKSEAQSGSGVMRATAIAVCEIGEGG